MDFEYLLEYLLKNDVKWDPCYHDNNTGFTIGPIGLEGPPDPPGEVGKPNPDFEVYFQECIEDTDAIVIRFSLNDAKLLKILQSFTAGSGPEDVYICENRQVKSETLREGCKEEYEKAKNVLEQIEQVRESIFWKNTEAEFNIYIPLHVCFDREYETVYRCRLACAKGSRLFEFLVVSGYVKNHASLTYRSLMSSSHTAMINETGRWKDYQWKE